MYSVVGNDGAIYGPVDMATLAQWIAEGRVTPETQLIDPLDGRTLPAGSAPALLGTFPTAPGPAAPLAAPPATMPQATYVDPAAPPAFYPRGDLGAYYGPPKSKAVAALLAFFLGGLGIHRFYLGHTTIGVVQVLVFLLGFPTCGIAWIATVIWAIVDFVLILVDGLREANGRPLQ